MGISQINKNIALFNESSKSFSILTLSKMVNKFCRERLDNSSHCESKKLDEINPFDGSFRIEISDEIKQDDTTAFMRVKSFNERAKEEGLI